MLPIRPGHQNRAAFTVLNGFENRTPNPPPGAPGRPWMTPRGYDRFSTPHASHESRLISPLSYNGTALGGRTDFLLPRPK